MRTEIALSTSAFNRTKAASGLLIHLKFREKEFCKSILPYLFSYIFK